MEITESIFREYDIRGIYPNQINEEVINHIGLAIAHKCYKEKIRQIFIGRDGRLSGKKLLNSLANSLSDYGIDVIDIGLVTSPLLLSLIHI